jgi:hypothetical protein
VACGQRTRRLTGLSRLGVVVAWVATLVVVAIAPHPAGAQISGTSELRIEVDLDAERLIVEETIHPTGPSNAIVWVPAEAIEVTTDASVVARRSVEGFTELELAGTPDGAVVSYQLVSTKARAAQGTRVNTAMVGFNLWPNYETTSVSITLPPGFSANVGAPFVPRLVGEETLEYVAEEASIDELWGYWFVAFRDSGLVTRLVDIGDGKVEVAGWADDPEWMGLAVYYVGRGVPVLVDLIGQPWPEDDLRVVESVAPAQEGYGGWYDRLRSEIEVPDTLDGDVMLHELAHAWFNDRWFEERWIIEGLAEEYAALARAELDDATVEATGPTAKPSTLQGLNDWRTRFFFEDTWDEELYGYETSFWVIQQLREEIGVEGLAATIDTMLNAPHPYATESDTRRVGTNDWRRFLDSLELRGGSTTAEDLFRQYVVTSAEARQLDNRSEVSALYRAFADDQPEKVPEAIRIAMSEWQFNRARTLIDDAEDVLADLDAIAERTDALGLAVPDYLESLYLDSESSFAVVDRAIDETEDVLASFEAAPDEITDDDRRNFSLGRYERIDAAPVEPSGPVLNQNREGGQPVLAYLAVMGVLGLCLFAAFVVFVRIVSREEAEASQSASA